MARYTQGSYDALLAPADPAGVSLAERALIALRVAKLTANAALTEHYQQRLQALGVGAATIAAVEQFPAGSVLTAPRVFPSGEKTKGLPPPLAATKKATAFSGFLSGDSLPIRRISLRASSGSSAVTCASNCCRVSKPQKNRPCR